MPDIKNILSHFSLSESEADLYLAVLSLEAAGVSDIAHKIGKNRTAVYFHIKNLLAKGMIKETRKGKRFSFVAVPPKELAERFDRLTTDFKSLVPQLEALRKIDSETPAIEINESKRGYKKVYDAISALPTGSYFRILEGRTALHAELDLLAEEHWQTFFSRVVERKIETKALFTEESLSVPRKVLGTDVLKKLEERVWHIRTLPEEKLPFQQLLLIYGSTVAFLFPETALVMTVQHSGMAQSLVSLFDTLYQFSRPAHVQWH